MLLAEPELTRATAARGSGVDVDVEVVGGGASGQSRVIDEQEGHECQHTRQA
jgi:ribosomal protein S9